MPRKITLPRFASLLVLPLVLSANSCEQERPRLVLPPVERAAVVARPEVPAGEAVCDGAPCLSDRQIGALLAAFAGALDEANRNLAFLRDWITTAAAK